MARNDPPKGSGGPSSSEEDLTQHPLVDKLKPDPAAPAERVRTLAGIIGDSDRDGYRRLYFSREMTFYAEFRTEDVIYTEAIPDDSPPFLGVPATRVALRRDATVEFTRVKAARPLDEFDLDIRLGRRRAVRSVAEQLTEEPETWEAECPGPSLFAPCETDFTCVCGDTVQITICRGATCIDVCETRFRTCDTCRTECNQATCVDTQCNQATCVTCPTRCNQNTCQITCTCPTQCRQVTCVTCPTRCNQDTCNTCETRCTPTCLTCDTCNPHVFTCGFDRQCV